MSGSQPEKLADMGSRSCGGDVVCVTSILLLRCTILGSASFFDSTFVISSMPFKMDGRSAGVL